MGKNVGYARVSLLCQDLTVQREALISAGCSRQFIFTDKASGAKADRPGLERCLSKLETGDTLIVMRLDRLGRSLIQLVNLINMLREQRINFKSLSDGVIDTTTASGELVFNIFASIAQFERRLIQERVHKGLEAARARGKKGGRPFVRKDNPKVIAAKKMYEDKTMSFKEIGEAIGVGKSTVYRYIHLIK